MTAYDENAVRLLDAAKKFIAQNHEMSFAAETVAETALKVADGNMQLAEDLLQNMAQFSMAALLKLRERPRDDASGAQASSDQSFSLLDCLRQTAQNDPG